MVMTLMKLLTTLFFAQKPNNTHIQKAFQCCRNTYSKNKLQKMMEHSSLPPKGSVEAALGSSLIDPSSESPLSEV